MIKQKESITKVKSWDSWFKLENFCYISNLEIQLTSEHLAAALNSPTRYMIVSNTPNQSRQFSSKNWCKIWPEAVNMLRVLVL